MLILLPVQSQPCFKPLKKSGHLARCISFMSLVKDQVRHTFKLPPFPFLLDPILMQLMHKCQEEVGADINFN